jgi:hypothetical protein
METGVPFLVIGIEGKVELVLKADAEIIRYAIENGLIE